ncbi:unnamed protein product [Camellia sinensis]
MIEETLRFTGVPGDYICGWRILLHSFLAQNRLDFACRSPSDQFTNYYDYVFAENGLVAYKDGKLIGTQFENYDKVFPQGWDKTYCLRYVDDFHEIHYFGDRIYKVTSPEDTVKQCTTLFVA